MMQDNPAMTRAVRALAITREADVCPAIPDLDPALVMECMAANGRLLYHLDRQLRTLELCRAAVLDYPGAIAHVPDCLKEATLAGLSSQDLAAPPRPQWRPEVALADLAQCLATRVQSLEQGLQTVAQEPMQVMQIPPQHA